MSSRRPVKQQELAMMQELRGQGQSFHEIARQLGRPVSTVYKVLQSEQSERCEQTLSEQSEQVASEQSEQFASEQSEQATPDPVQVLRAYHRGASEKATRFRMNGYSDAFGMMVFFEAVERGLISEAKARSLIKEMTKDFERLAAEM